MAKYKNKNKYSVTERFLKYVKIGTQSDDKSPTYPSTEGQWQLLRLLENELLELGLAEVNLDKYGYLTATLPSNINFDSPVIGFFAHVDTSSSVPGEIIYPIVHKDYQGQSIKLPADKTQIVSVQTNVELAHMIGHDLITSDGSTLLGADDKCGVAEIMEALNYFVQNPKEPRPTIKVCFNPDEEIGRGTEHFDVNKFAADFAYTLDGPGFGTLESENFNAINLEVIFVGKNYHPGYAKDRMINSVRLAGAFVDLMPKDKAPETTEDDQGYLHPMEIYGNEEKTIVTMILRDFGQSELEKKLELVKKTAKKVAENYPGSKFEIKWKQVYSNMQYVLEKFPDAMSLATRAYRSLGVEPKFELIRGGTDGVMLSQKGLPCPNLSSGQHNPHSRTEFTSRQEMEACVDLIVQIATEATKIEI